MHVMCENNEWYECKTTRWMQKKKKKNSAMHVNPKHNWCMKRQIGQTFKNWKFFSFDWLSIDRIPIESGKKSWLKIKGILINRKTHSIDWNSGNLIFFLKNCRRLCRKQLNPSNFMNEMHENEFKSFSKTWVFNWELQNKDF